MADDVVNLEDETPVAPVEAPVEAPPAEAGPAEVDAVEVGGQKYVPVAALIAERAEKKTLKDRASRADVLEQENAQMRPYAQFLAAHPELMQPAPRQEAPATSVVDQKALQIAKALDLYKPDGTPDVDRAATLRQIVREDATEASHSVVQPVQYSNDQRAAAALYQEALNTVGPDGAKVNVDIFNNLVGTMANRPDLLKDRGVMSLLHAAAVGFTKRATMVAPPAGPPLISEATVNRPGRPSVTSLDEAVAKHRGVSAESMAKLATGFTKGRPSPLEDD